MEKEEMVKIRAEELFDMIPAGEQEDIIFQMQTAIRMRKIMAREAEKEAQRRVDSLSWGRKKQ